MRQLTLCLYNYFGKNYSYFWFVSKIKGWDWGRVESDSSTKNACQLATKDGSLLWTL